MLSIRVCTMNEQALMYAKVCGRKNVGGGYNKYKHRATNWQ
jgi:hypothetical protein